MANYKQNAVAGTSWTRARKVTLDNPYGEVPSIKFDEEILVVIGDQVLKQQIDSSYNNGVVGDFSSGMGTTFDLLNPETEEKIGTMTYESFYVTLYSMYRHLADQRDARVEASNVPTPLQADPPPPPPEPVNPPPPGPVPEPAPSPDPEPQPIPTPAPEPQPIPTP